MLIIRTGMSCLIGVCILASAIPQNAKSQNNQDCFSAIKVCTNTYLQTTASNGFGILQDVTQQTTCLYNGETNSTWYTFKVKSGGTLSFQINPLNLLDDYDFVVYDLTNNSCSDIVNGTVEPLRCNFSSAAGSTGLSQGFNSTSSTSGDANQNAILAVQSEQTFVLMVNNFTATEAGYELDFGGTAIIYDTEPPEISYAAVSPCSPSIADIYFSEDINCASIAADGSDFRITGPSNVSITSAGGSGCHDNQSLASFIRLNFSSGIVTPGNYKIHIKKGTDGNTVSDFCDNMINVGAVIDFNVTFAGPATTISEHTNTDCSNTGSATALVTGGTPPLNYVWNTIPRQNVLTAQNLAAGIYTFTVTDLNGCVVSAAVRIDSTGYPEITPSVIPVRCDSIHSGSATVNVSGGVFPYTYQWSTSSVQTSATATGLSPQTYSVTVTGANGCTAITNVTIPLTGLPVLNTTFTNVSCNAQIAGTVVVVATGNAPFIYQWSTSTIDTFPTLSGLSHGIYTVTVTDAVGCTQKANVTIAQGGLQLTGSTVNLTCATIPSGSATVNAFNGVTPYSYIWETNPPQFNSTLVNLDKGNYTVVVTDAGGCKDSLTVQITSPPAIAISANTTDADCGFANGIITAATTGGIAPYSYQWSTNPVQHNITAVNLAAGIYNITVTDNTGCSATSPVYLSNPNGPSGFISDVIDATCNQPNGSAAVTNVSGNGPFSYTWNTAPQQHQANAVGLADGIYYVMIQNAAHCISFLHVKINTIAPAEISISNISAASCGKNDGKATVIFSGGISPYQCEWLTNPLQNSPTAFNLSGGNYLAVLIDGNGCKDSISVSVPEKKALNDFSFTPACLNSPVSFTATTDYNQPVNWSWNFGDDFGTHAVSALESQTSHVFSSTDNYLVTLIITGGCATDTIIKTVKGAYKPVASFTTKQKEFYADGPVQFIYTGSEVQYYQWNFDSRNVSYDANPVYTFKNLNDSVSIILYVTDDYGCKDTATTSIYIDNPPSVFIPGAFTPNGDGLNDTFIIPSFALAECTLQIVNRWGETIFTSANPSQLMSVGWNGTFKGQAAPEGGYTYLLRGKLATGKLVAYSGMLTLVR